MDVKGLLIVLRRNSLAVKGSVADRQESNSDGRGVGEEIG